MALIASAGVTPCHSLSVKAGGAPPEHRLSQQGQLKRVDLAGIQVLSIDPRHHFHQQMRDICNDLGVELLGDYEGTSLDSLCQMCASGLGIAILPELYLQSEVGGKNVIAPLPVTDWSATRSIGALWRNGSVYGENYAKIADVIGREAGLLFHRTHSVMPALPGLS